MLLKHVQALRLRQSHGAAAVTVAHFHVGKASIFNFCSTITKGSSELPEFLQLQLFSFLFIFLLLRWWSATT